MELRHLRYFCTVAAEGHVTRAAERIGIQQPPLSRSMKGLEAELGVQLFLRTPHGVELTDAGRVFLERAKAVLANVHEATEVTRGTARGEQGRITVGFTPTGPFHPFVTTTIRDFRQAFPAISLGIEEHRSGDLVEHLKTGRLDAAFVWMPRVEGISVKPLVDEKLLVAAPAQGGISGRRGKSGVSLRQLADETFVTYGRRDGFGLYAATIVACNAAGFSPRFGPEAPRLAAALSLVSVGLGVFLVPACVARLRMEGVVYLPLTGNVKPEVSLNLISRPRERSAVVQHFLRFVTERIVPQSASQRTMSSARSSQSRP